VIYWGIARVPKEPRHAYGLDPKRLVASAILAYEDFYVKKCAVSRHFPLEVLTYYYASHEIKKVLSLSAKELEGKKYAFFADVEIPPGAVWYAKVSSCKLAEAPREWYARAMYIRLMKRRKWCGK
jgi:hypothetical protein